MAFNPNEEGDSFERELVPSGVHAARVARVIEIGQQYSAKYDTTDDKVIVSFSLPNVVRDYGELGEKQAFIGTSKWGIKKSKDDKSTMKKYAKAIDPQKETKDYSEWLNRPCQISVVHRYVDDKTYANLDSVAPILPGFQVGELDTEPFFFEFDNPDPAIWVQIPEWIQEVIQGAVNYPGSKVEAMVNSLEDESAGADPDIVM